MNDLRITLVQAPLEWENPEANHLHFSTLLKDASDTDLVVLPEMFTTGFTMDASSAAEPHTASMKTLVWMRSEAQRLNAAIAGSVAVKEGEHFYNRLYWVQPDGKLFHYDKRHLFTFAGEHRVYTPGNQRLVVQWRGWKILLQICYDLRFPESARNGIANGEPVYDALVYVANWPEARRDAWSTLLKARAIENQCYVLGTNRVGADANGIQYSGNSAVHGPKGELLSGAADGATALINARLSAAELAEFRAKFPVLYDRRQ